MKGKRLVALVAYLQNFSEVLPSFASELQTNCSCIAPDSFELQTLQSTRNESCPQQLFYSVSVLTESETKLNATLHEWLSLHNSVTVAGIELVVNPACAPVLAAAVPSPVCSPSVPTTGQTTSSTCTVPSEEPTSQDQPRETPTASTTDSSDSEGSSDSIIVFIVVFVLVATFVLLTLMLVIMLFFFRKRRKHVSDFAVES